MSKLAENLKEIRAQNTGKKYIRDWVHNLPEGSRWTPGSNGDPACQICMGIGWLRPDVPTFHPRFGKLFPCECVDPSVKIKFDRENNWNNGKVSREERIYPD